MHLLAGIIKTLIKDCLQDFLKLKNAHANFFRLSADVLSEIQTMNISWCKVLSFADGKLGGWTSKNYFAYARLMDWHLFLTKFLKISSDTPYQDPTTPYTSWSGKLCKEWLYSRNLITSGKAAELKDRVKRFMESRKIPVVIDSKTLQTDKMFSIMHFILVPPSRIERRTLAKEVWR
jgi:hypothetical protein